MPRRRALDPHKFTPAYASTTKCITCGRSPQHWLHRGILYRMLHRRPGNVDTPSRKGR